MGASQGVQIHVAPNAGDKRIMLFKKMRAKVCHHCPLCSHVRRNPDSRIAKIHHKYHAQNCPLWNAEQEVYGPGSETGSPKLKALMIWKPL